MKTFYLIDGHAQIFRSYYAPFGALTSPSGEPTKAVFLFTQMLLSLLENDRPDYLAIALDHGDESTERKKLYPEYKANRDRAPEDFGPQVERIIQLIDLLGIPRYEVPGQEADDIIATLAGRIAAEGGEEIELRILSKDKDLYQILDDRTKLWEPGKGVQMDPALLVEKLGISPAQAVELQTLTGDSTDNIPGVHGVGPKKAAALIGKYGDVAGVIAHAGELTPKLRESIVAHGDTFDLTRRLVTLRRDVPLEFQLDECRPRPISVAAVRPLLEELGLSRLLGQVERMAGSGAEPGAATTEDRQIRGDLHLVHTEAELDAFLERLEREKLFALDTETTSLRAVDCDLVGLSFSWKSGEGWYLALRSSQGPTLDPARTLERLRPILESEAWEKCGQNIKFDRVALLAAGIDLRGIVFDTMVASYLALPERSGHGMDGLARDLLGYRTIPISDLIGKGKSEISMRDVPLERIAEYAAEDADITWRLYEKLREAIAGAAVEKLFREIEMPLVEVLADMEFAGVVIDKERLAATREKMAARVVELEREVWAAAGREFNIDSPKQLSEILFDDHKLRVVKRTKTGRSTDASVLEVLAVETAHPLPRLLLEYRELKKLLGTYVDPLPEYISPRTGRLHASFHQTIAATGRLSSSDPNLQNIPVRSEQGREIRRAFVAGAPDRVLLTADYSQIELRILAHLSRDPALSEAFRTDQDIHAYVASQIHCVPVAEVTRDMRSRAKAVNFGIIYGQGAFGLARALGIPRADAARFIDEYKARYPGIVRFMDDCVRQALETGEVTTMLGRRRPVPEIRSGQREVRAQGERIAINTVVQGSAADMIKTAMVRLHRRIRAEKLDLRLLIQVHDELVFEAPRHGVEPLAEIVRAEMAAALPLDVPVVVDVAWGDDWLEGKE